MRLFHKLLSILLCFCVLFSSSVNNFVYAMPVDEYEQIPFSRNFAGDSITFTDENGLIIEVRANDISTYSATGTLTLSALGAGAMGVGSGTILSAALPILAVIVGLGITVYSVPALCDKVMEVYYSLPDDALQELAVIASAGASSFILPTILKTALTKSINDVFYEDDGTFQSIGITFNPANMLEYDFSSQFVNGNKLTSTVYNTALSTGLATAIAGTTLTAQIVDTPFDSTYFDKALKIVNTATGASVVLQAGGTILNSDCGNSTFKISAPVVVTESVYGGIARHTLGFWILTECATRLSGQSCSMHNYAYQSSFYSEKSGLATDTNLFLFENTGNSLLDGKILSGQVHSGFHEWWLYFAEVIDDVRSICVDFSALSLLFGTTAFDMVYNPTGALTYDDTYYLPTADVLSDVDRLTAEGVKTGTFEDVVSTPSNPSIPDTDLSLWERLWAWLQALLDAILGIPSAIVEAIKGLADWLKSAIIEALRLAFVPSDTFFSTFFSDLQATFQDRFGLLTYPISVIFTFFDSLLSVGNEEPVLSWSGWSYEGVEVIKGGSFNLAEVLENDTFRTIHNIYLVVVDAGIIFAFLRFIDRKYRSVISN